MASIIQVGEKWRAQVRRKGHPAMTRTFATKKEADQWARRIESGIDQAKPALLAEELTTAALIAKYREMRVELGRPVQPDTNTHYMLNHLEEDLGADKIRDLTPERLTRWARMRHAQGAGGYTVNMELSQLGTAIRHTSAYLQVTLPDVVGAARPILHYAQLTSSARSRARRVTEDELTRLLAWLRERNPVTADAVEVAAITGMRRGEIARIEWRDVDEATRAVLVRKRKHPRAIEARDEWVPLLGDAWEIVQRQPRTRDRRIFQVSRETLTDSVTEGTRALGIPDLRLHDLRHEATSRLKEMGFDVDDRKAVTGHRSDKIHSRYVHVQMQDLHQRYDAARGTPPRPQRPRKAGDRPDAATGNPPTPGDS